MSIQVFEELPWPTNLWLEPIIIPTLVLCIENEKTIFAPLLEIKQYMDPYVQRVWFAIEGDKQGILYPLMTQNSIYASSGVSVYH